MKMYDINIEGKIVFTYKGLNYLYKMYDDLDFLQNSHIAQFTNIAKESDPLLLASSKSDSNKTGKKQIIVTIPPPLRPRVVAALNCINAEHQEAGNANNVSNKQESPSGAMHALGNEIIGNQEEVKKQKEDERPITCLGAMDMITNQNNALITSGNAMDHQDFNALIPLPPEEIKNQIIASGENDNQISFALSNTIT